MAELLPPSARTNQIGLDDLEVAIRAIGSTGGLSHGWMITGPRRAGKATLAYRIARGLLDPRALVEETSFDVAPDSQVFKLIAQGAHPRSFCGDADLERKDRKIPERNFR